MVKLVSVQHPALLQPCSPGNVQSLILPRQEFYISSAQLLRIVLQCGTSSMASCTAQGRDGFTTFPLPLWSVWRLQFHLGSFILHLASPVTQTQERKAVPNYPKYASAIKAQTQNGGVILYPVISSNSPSPSFSTCS